MNTHRAAVSALATRLAGHGDYVAAERIYALDEFDQARALNAAKEQAPRLDRALHIVRTSMPVRPVGTRVVEEF